MNEVGLERGKKGGTKKDRVKYCNLLNPQWKRSLGKTLENIS